jgi:hypothetical protein
MDAQFIFNNRHNFATQEERENVISKYPLSDQIADLQQIEICSNEIASKMNKTIEEIKTTCQEYAKLILAGKPTISGLISKSPNGDLKKCYQKIVRSYLRIIWKLDCDKKLKERECTKPPLNLTEMQNNPLPDFPEEKLR